MRLPKDLTLLGGTKPFSTWVFQKAARNSNCAPLPLLAVKGSTHLSCSSSQVPLLPSTDHLAPESPSLSPQPFPVIESGYLP